jgi:isochorismate synthase
MPWEFHGRGGLNPQELIQALPEIDLSRIAFGLHYFPETGLADFFACDADNLVPISSPLQLSDYVGNSAFVAFPFQGGATGYLIPPFLGVQECVSRRFVVEGFFREDADEPGPAHLQAVQFDSEEDYKEKVFNALELIRSGTFEKVVLSRSFADPYSRAGLSDFLSRVFNTYPQANLIVFNIPGKGLWISASPEILLASGHSILGFPQTQIISHALAGTKPLSSDHPWTEKEVREQALVAGFIEDKFTALAGKENLQKVGPMPHAAGELQHLSTIFHFAGGNQQLAVHLAASLHPTPAVCGFPFEASYAWLLENEKLDRSFFSGFSGSFHPERMKFVVNLRTACFRDDHLIFYAGAGIVEGSDPEAELAETNAKINTLRKLS